MIPVRMTVYRGARANVPSAADDLTWPEFAEELEAIANEPPTAPQGADRDEQKRTLIAWAPHRLREGTTRALANVDAITALAIDVDVCDGEAVCARLEGTAAIVYGSPSDDATRPDARRLRVVAPVTREITPGECERARFAFAERLGLKPGCGVEGAKDASRLFFAGRLHGTPERDVVRFDGAAVDVDELLAAPLEHDWAMPQKATLHTACNTPVSVNDRVARVVGVLYAHYAAGGRHELCRALGGWLARFELGAWSDAEIEAVVRALPSDQTETRVRTALDAATQARTGAVTPGWTALAARIGDADAARLELAARSEWWTRKLAAAPADPDAAAFHPPDAGDDTLPLPAILRSRDGHVTLLWEREERGHRPIAESVLIARIKELGLDGIIELNEGKRARSVAAILNDAATYGRTAYAYDRERTEYDPAGEGSVTIGYPPSGIVAAFDADVDAWLRALAGDLYPRLEVWLASCTQANIGRLAACLILVGPADVGKSCLAYGAARLWGAEPPAMALVVRRFNADMLRAPILVDEEAQLFGSRELSTKRFRDIVQAPSRAVEGKGKEQVQLLGAQRYIVGCNGLSDLRFTDLGGPDVIKALRDRLLAIVVADAPGCVAALARMRMPGGYLVDLGRIARHVAWLGETVTMPIERFIGAGGAVSDGAILAGHVEDNAELWETLYTWIDTGRDAGWSAVNGILAANPAALALALESTHKWDLPRVRAALGPFKLHERRPRVPGRPRLWLLDALRIAEALDLDGATADAMLSRLAGASDAPRAGVGKFARSN